MEWGEEITEETMINPKELQTERLGEAIMNIVLDAVTDRRGWRQEWHQFDSEIQEEIKDILWKKINVALNAAPDIPLEELREAARRIGHD